MEDGGRSSVVWTLTKHEPPPPRNIPRLVLLPFIARLLGSDSAWETPPALTPSLLGASTEAVPCALPCQSVASRTQKSFTRLSGVPLRFFLSYSFKFRTSPSAVRIVVCNPWCRCSAMPTTCWRMPRSCSLRRLRLAQDRPQQVGRTKPRSPFIVTSRYAHVILHSRCTHVAVMQR